MAFRWLVMVIKRVHDIQIATKNVYIYVPSLVHNSFVCLFVRAFIGLLARSFARSVAPIMDLKLRRRAQRTTTGCKISPYCATAQARLVVHMKFRTSKRQVCRPERTRVCIYVFTECLR